MVLPQLLPHACVEPDHLAAQLQELGVVLLRDFFPGNSLTWLRDAAGQCFETITNARVLPERYKFDRFLIPSFCNPWRILVVVRKN